MVSVLHVTNAFTDDGTGITNVLAELAMGQLREGYSVHIATSDTHSPLSREAAELGAKLVYIPPIRGTKSLLESGRRLRSVLSGARVDVIHVHTVKSILAVVVASPILLRRTVSTVHNVHQRSSILMLFAARPVHVSAAGAASGPGRIKFVREKTRSIPNGTLGSTRRRHKSTTPDIVASMRNSILFVGGLVPRKGVWELVKRFDVLHARLPDSSLYLLGNRDNPELEAFADSLESAKAIHFVGFVSDTEPFLKAASVLVLPSLRESFGLVIIEARAHGLPIIASDVDGVPEAVDMGQAGMLIDPKDDTAWVHAMMSVLSSQDSRRKWSQRALTGLDNFTVSTMVRRYGEVYAEVAN